MVSLENKYTFVDDYFFISETIHVSILVVLSCICRKTDFYLLLSSDSDMVSIPVYVKEKMVK
jgi:hypothetical protein